MIHLRGALGLIFLLSTMVAPEGSDGQQPSGSQRVPGEVIEGQTTITLPDTAHYSLTERELVRLERRRSAAIAAHDTAWLAELYSSDFTGVPANGTRVDRAALLRIFMRDASGTHFLIDELQVRQLNPETAVVTGRLRDVGPSGSVGGESRYLHVYIVRDGRWQIVAAEGSAVLQSSPTGAGRPRRSARELYATYDSAAGEARRKGDWKAYRDNALIIDSLMNAHPLTTLALARAAARLGDSTRAFLLLRDFVATGIRRDLSSDSSFFQLHESSKWGELLRRLSEPVRRVGSWKAAFTVTPADFVAEDIAFDPLGRRFLVSSIRHRKILAVTMNGVAGDFLPASAGEWGILAVGVDSPRGRLWATSHSVPLMNGYTQADSGRTAILRMDLRTGSVEKRYDLPRDGKRHELGDMAVADNGDVFISDGGSGRVSVIRREADSLAVLVPEGEFISPQGPSISRDAKHLYVADYARGIAEVDRLAGSVRWLSHPRSIALNGIDGLVVTGSNTLLAVQNGFIPNRVLEVTFNPSSAIVTSTRVIAQDTIAITEPTHGVVVGRNFYFIANGGSGSFNEAGLRKPGVVVRGPVILRVSLPDAHSKPN